MPTRLRVEFLGRTCAVRSKRGNAIPVGVTAGGQIPNRRPSIECPAHVEARKQVGHWECDTVFGTKQKGAIVTMVERKSR